MSGISDGYDGARRAWEGTDDEWKEAAKQAVAKCIVRQPEFCSDDVWATGLPKPREARALGHVIVFFARDGHIEKTTRFKRSEQEGCHGMDVRIWRSLYYEQKHSAQAS